MTLFDDVVQRKWAPDAPDGLARTRVGVAKPTQGVLPARVAATLNGAVDLCALIGSAVFAAWWGADAHRANGVTVAWFAVVAIGVWLISSTALRQYDPGAYNRAATDDASLVTVLVLAVATVLQVVDVLLRRRGVDLAVGPFLLVALPSSLAARFLFRGLAQREGFVNELLIVGIGPIGRLTGEDLGKRRRHHLVGYLRFFDETDKDAALLQRNPVTGEVPYLGLASELEGVLRTTPVSEVYIAGNVRKHDEEMQACIKVCERLGVPFALPASGFRLERARPMDNHSVADGYIHYLSYVSKPRQMAVKRLFDIVSSAAALWLLLPLLLAIAALIKITSRGPILFKQPRVGLHGRTFHMLKFRSMVADAEALKPTLAALNEQTGPVFKMRNDPRVTRIGRFIRKYSIDELPQLINVLRGDMSVVGPRPPVPAEVPRYEAWQIRRLSVRPGLTCIWQVSGRNQISFEQWMYLDLQYIDHWSLAQDFSLIFKTVPVVITGRGAS